LTLPDPPTLAESPGSLDAEPRTVAAADASTPFAVAGLRACVTGEAWEGVDQVRTHPVRIATRPRITGAACIAATITPLGVERRLRLDDADQTVLIERIVVPRDGAAALFEWHAPDNAATVDLAWTTDLNGHGVPAAPASIRWRQAPWGALLAAERTDPADAGYRALFVFGHGLRALALETISGNAPAVRLRARLAIPAGGSVRLAMAGGPADATVFRAVRSAARGRVVVLARRGMLERLRAERLSIDSPEPALDRRLERERLELADRLVDTPGVGRSFVAGYTPDRLSYITVDAVRASRDSLLLGDFDAVRDVLRFLGRYQDAAGLIPWACTTAGDVSPGDMAATARYLSLAARFLAWTGDISFLRGEWAGVRSSCDPMLSQQHLRGAAPATAGLSAVVLHGLVHAAEAIGDATTAVRLRQAAIHAPAASPGAGPPVDDPEDRDGSEGAIARVRRVLAPAPDASRSRLVLRPRPPATWDRFDVHAMAIGDASIDLEYRRSDRTHRFTVTQQRGSAPLRLILAPELPGGLRTARVDGSTADLEPVARGDRTGIPVQLALDHQRTLELRMEDGRPLVTAPPST